MFLAPKGPSQIDPQAERERGLQESGMLQERGQHHEGPWDAGLQAVLTGLVTPLHPEMWLTCFPIESSWWLMPLFVPPEDRGLPNPGSC